MNITTFDDLFRTAMAAPGATAPRPFPYQVAFATAPEFPHVVQAPTGAGKTATVLVGWLWRRRYQPDQVARAATPRRLVLCLPMRTLVEQTARVAEAAVANLGLADEVGVHVLMGGAVDRSWEGDIDRDLVLVGTQDQLLSRALNRGYAMSRYLWPVHFGLLNSDCLWVLDEVQLMGPGLSTSAQLQGLRDALGTAARTRSVWMSATMALGRLRTIDHRTQDLTIAKLTRADYDTPALAARHRAPKPVAATKATSKEPDKLAKEIAGAHQPGSLTLVVVNQVSRARALYAAVVKAAKGVEVRLIHSRFRPIERRAIADAVLAPGWSGILVATQAIEAGVDISARTLFTEVSLWSSMVQRFGRCNRRGEFGAAEAGVRWIDVPDGDAAPYTAEDLQRARAILAELEDVSPATLATVPEDDGEPVLPVIRRRDVLDLFDTQPDLAGHDLDISRFIRDSDDRDVQVAWRELGDKPPPADSAELQRDELCSVSIGEAKKFLDKVRKYQWAGATGAWEPVRNPAPGMAILIDASEGGYDAALGWTGDPRDKPPTAPTSTAAAPDAADDDRLTYCGEYVTLMTHSADVHEEAAALREAIAGDQPWDVVVRAALWHDLGKAHPVFANMLRSGLTMDDPRREGGPWAKSDGRRTARPERPGFRHELASALAFLAHGGDDLTAFLIAAHHGKVRMTLRAQPNEKKPADGARFAFGVHDGDEFPAVDLGAEQTRAVQLDLSLMELGLGPLGPSWSERMRTLLATHGPFRLAYWEALVRIADWRGTRRRVTATAGVSP
jgi:CRISPR-associated endonuclease/helicase Cas3